MGIKNSHVEILKAGCIVVDAGKVLLVTNNERNVWSYPKGHAEAGETMEQVALRETLEETGYRVKIVQRLADLTYTNNRTSESIRVAMFLAKPIERVDKVNDELSEWVDIKTAKNLLVDNLKPYVANM